MSAHVLLNLLNELGKSDKMRGLLVLKRFHHGVISGRRPGIVWSKATFRYALTI